MPEIICTVGPSSRDPETWGRMVDAGCTGFRIPFSKETPSIQFERGAAISRYFGGEIAIYADLPGRVPRTCNSDDVPVVEGPLNLTNAEHKDEGGLGVSPFESLAQYLSVGDTVSIGDGEVRGQCVSLDQAGVCLSIDVPGIIKPYRRVSWVGSGLSTGPLSERDRALLADPNIAHFSHIMASHVSAPADVEALRVLIREGVSICAKVEDELGVSNLSAIATVADSVLLGQGDLMNDVGPVRFGGVVGKALAQSRSLPVPLFVGTQLLDGFAVGRISRPELAFLHLIVANGASGILLSGETTIGADPAGVVAMARAVLSDFSDGEMRHL